MRFVFMSCYWLIAHFYGVFFQQNQDKKLVIILIISSSEGILKEILNECF